MKEVTGNLQVKNGKYYVLVNLYDRSGKRPIKWVSPGLDSKGSKKAAKARMAEVLEEYNRSQRKLLRAVSKKNAPEQFIQQRERIQCHRQQQKMNTSVLWGAYCHDYDDYVCTDATGKLMRPDYSSKESSAAKIAQVLAIK